MIREARAAVVPLGLLGFMLALPAEAAPAGDSRLIVLVRGGEGPGAGQGIVAETIARIRGELTAAGFDTFVVPQDAGTTPRGAVEAAARDLAPAAVLAVAIVPPGGPPGGHPEGPPAAAEVWLSDRVSGRTVVQRVQLDAEPDRTAAVLAVYAVDLVRATLAERWVAPRAGTRSVARLEPAPAVAILRPPTRYLTTGVAVEVGAGWLEAGGGVDLALAPVLKLSWGRENGLAARVAAWGLGPRDSIQAAAGAAEVGQALATIEAVLPFRLGHRVQALISGGAGIHHLSVEGRASSPYRGRNAGAWSAVGVAGAGLGMVLTDRLSVVAEAQVTALAPSTVIWIADDEVARTGGLGVFAGVGLLGRR